MCDRRKCRAHELGARDKASQSLLMLTSLFLHKSTQLHIPARVNLATMTQTIRAYYKLRLRGLPDETPEIAGEKNHHRLLRHAAAYRIQLYSLHKHAHTPDYLLTYTLKP